MKNIEFKKGIYDVLGHVGFYRYGNIMQTSGDGVKILLEVKKGFGEQWFINLGFCLDRFGLKKTTRVEQADMYFRLERVFPKYRETILAAGDLEDPAQAEAYRTFLQLLGKEIVEDLKTLGSEHGLIDAYRLGRLSEGLVTAATRDLIATFF